MDKGEITLTKLTGCGSGVSKGGPSG